MLSDKKPVSIKLAETTTYPAYFKQTGEQESNELATELRISRRLATD